MAIENSIYWINLDMLIIGKMQNMSWMLYMLLASSDA